MSKDNLDQYPDDGFFAKKALANTTDLDKIAKAVSARDPEEIYWIARNPLLSPTQIELLYFGEFVGGYLYFSTLLRAPNCSPEFLHKVVSESSEPLQRALAFAHPNATEETKVLGSLRYYAELNHSSEWTTR